MAAPQDFHTLYETGSYAAALKSIKSIELQRQLRNSENVLLAELLAERSDYDSALSLAQRLATSRGLSTRERCRVRSTLGVCYFRKGNASKAIDEYRSGIEFALRSNERREECWLRVQLFRDQVRWLGPQHSDADLATLRRKLHQVADPVITVIFQLGLAELAANLALLPRARRHLETARALLPRVSNEAAQISFRFSEVALVTEEGDFDEALPLGLELAADPEAPAGSNLPTLLAHILIAKARFAEAEKWLERAFNEITIGGGNDLLLRETILLLKLRQGDLEEAEAIDASARRLMDERGTHDSHYGLRYLATQVMWLYRVGRSEEGLAVARGALPRIERVADRVLFARMKLLAAEGMGLTGDGRRGAEMIAEVFADNPEPPLDVSAEAIRVAGKLVAHEDPGTGHAQLQRAAHIYRCLGNTATADEIEREANGRTSDIDDRPPAAPYCERIAALLDMGGHARLLGSEVLSLCVNTQSVVQARLTETGPGGRSDSLAVDAADDASDHQKTELVRIEFGKHHDRQYELRARPKPSAAARGTLLALARLTQAARALAKARHDQREQALMWPEQTPEQQLGLICSSERMLGLVTTIRRVAAANVTVLLTGETGVGKELFARAVHQASPRRDNVFLPFNCATVPREMFDSQLFGHRRGSFTGAVDDAPGMIRSAAGGTLFLDEIGEMSLDTQPKLLRFLESGEIRPLGEAKPQLVDVRIVAATNANLDHLIAEGRFREDLYYRLNVIRINIPPLRDRREEIPALVDHFLERYGREFQKPQLRVSDEALEYLVLYRWPGNVRQLANEIRRMVALAEPGAVLMPAHLSDDIAASRKTIPADRPALHSTEVMTRLDQPLNAAVEHIERAAIRRAVAVAEGNLIEAARMLGLSRKGLYLKRQRLGLE